MDSTADYDVFAVKYAENTAPRTRLFYGGDDHETDMDMDFFVWVVRRQDTGRVWVIDTGFAEFDAELRDRRLVRSVSDALATVGVAAAEVSDVIITHLHYDHIGGFEQFPNATFHLQDREMAYATGRHMTQPPLAHAYTGRHVADMVLHVFDQRVTFYDGDAELDDGLSVHLVGGHTMGLQVVRVHTEAGWLVLASDATHYYENMALGLDEPVRPFAIVQDVGQMIQGYRRLRELADAEELIVPGHDPLVFDRFPAVESHEGVAVHLSGLAGGEVEGQ